MSISAKIRIAAVCQTKEQAAMAGRTGASGPLSICDEINNYLLNIDIYGNFSGMSISAKIRFPAVCRMNEQAAWLGETADSGAGRFDDEINNYLLNRIISDSFLGMSISAKIRFPAVCRMNEQAAWLGETADSGADRFDDEINNYLLNRIISDSFPRMSISAKIRIALRCRRMERLPRPGAEAGPAGQSPSGRNGSTGRPASAQPLRPPAMCATLSKPIRRSVSAASAERPLLPQ